MTRATSPPVPYLPWWWAASGSERWLGAGGCLLGFGWLCSPAERVGWTAPSSPPGWGCRRPAPRGVDPPSRLFLPSQTPALSLGPPEKPALGAGLMSSAVGTPAGWGGRSCEDELMQGSSMLHYITGLFKHKSSLHVCCTSIVSYIHQTKYNLYVIMQFPLITQEGIKA